jgi:alpha-ketoglutarate-dependent taurine dioxygenase
MQVDTAMVNLYQFANENRDSAWSGPLVVERRAPAELLAWTAGNRPWIEQALLEHGAILFRGFGVTSPACFRDVAAAMCGRLIEYTYRSTPRTELDKNIYTATEYHADAVIPLHNENSYQCDWPMRLVFCCITPAAQGGETPLAPTANITRLIGDDLMKAFSERGIMYVRNFGQGVDLSWQTAFQTESKAEVESFCRQASIEWEWDADGNLRTHQVCHATATHPDTGQHLWFNQAHLFHVSSLGPEDAEALLEVFGEAGLPRHAYYGDGRPIEMRFLERIRSAYQQERFTFSWQSGDVLLLDNMLVAHARNSYQGARKVLAAMADPFSAWPRRHAVKAGE